MVGVLCTHGYECVRLERFQEVGTGSRVALDRFPFWRIRVRVDICRFRSVDLDLHMLCGKETPAGPNRFESPQLLSEEDSINCAAS
jgi:hypothetical protein